MTRTKRKSSGVEGYHRTSRSVSFVGVEGYEILHFFDDVGSRFEYGKSGLIIELLKIYRESIELFGESEAIFRMKMALDKERNK